MEALKLLLGSDIGLLSLFTIGFVIVMGFYLVGFIKKNAADDARRKDAKARREALNDADFFILCLPDDAARDAVAMIANGRTRVIDASTAHRVAPGWVYGFPEISGHDAVASAARVSNPGCYSTGFIALIAPLVRAGLLPADWPYACNAVSGCS